MSKIQQEFICKPHAVLGQGVLIFQTTASNYMNEDIDHSFLVPSACIRSHSCFSSEFSFELPLGNIRTFFKCHLFWSQGVSQLQGDGVMDAWNNVKILGEKFWFDDNFAIIYSNFKPRQINCFKPFCFRSPFVSSLPHRASFLFFSSEDFLIALLGFLLLDWKLEGVLLCRQGEGDTWNKNRNKTFWFKRQFFAAYFLSNQSMMYPRNYEIRGTFPNECSLSS